MYTHTHTHTHIFTYIHIYTYLYIVMCVCVCVGRSSHDCVYVRACLRVYNRVCLSCKRDDHHAPDLVPFQPLGATAMLVYQNIF